MRKEKLDELNSYIEEFKTKKLELVENKNKFLKIKTYKSYLEDGRELVRDKLIKGTGDGNAVIILPITTDNEVILTVQPRIFTKSTVGIALPAGYVEDKEKHIDGARRELEEETGYQSDELIEVCELYQDEGCGCAYNKGYLALNCKKIGKQKLDKDEYIKYFKCSIDELYELVDKKYILDGGSLLLIEKAKKYIEERKKNEIV